MEYFVANGLISIPPPPPLPTTGTRILGKKSFFQTVSDSEYRNVLSRQPAVADGCSRCGGEESPPGNPSKTRSEEETGGSHDGCRTCTPRDGKPRSPCSVV